MNTNLVVSAIAMMEKQPFATLALVNEEGFPMASTVSPLENRGIAQVWISTGSQSQKMQCINFIVKPACVTVMGRTM
jgi:hypothetical protein